jgi:hypothetical protein
VQTPTSQVEQPGQTLPQAPQLLSSSLRSTQALALVPPPQQTVLPAQQRSGLSDPPGQKSSAGQQESRPLAPPTQTVGQQPSIKQQTSLKRQHSTPWADSQIRFVGGSPPGRLLVEQQISSAVQVPKQQALSQHSL